MNIEIDYRLLTALSEKQHPLLNIADDFEKQIREIPIAWTGEIFTAARTAHHLLDLADIPHDFGYASDLDSRTYLAVMELIELRRQLAAHEQGELTEMKKPDLDAAQLAIADRNYQRARVAVDHLMAMEVDEGATDLDTVIELAIPVAMQMSTLNPDPASGLYSAMIIAAELLRRHRKAMR